MWFQLLMQSSAHLGVLQNTTKFFEKHLVPVVGTVQSNTNTGRELAFLEEYAGEIELKITQKKLELCIVHFINECRIKFM